MMRCLRLRLLRDCVADLIMAAWPIKVCIPAMRLLYHCGFISSGRYARICVRGHESAVKRVIRGKANLLIIRAANDVMRVSRGCLR